MIPTLTGRPWTSGRLPILMYHSIAQAPSSDLVVAPELLREHLLDSLSEVVLRGINALAQGLDLLELVQSQFVDVFVECQGLPKGLMKSN